MVRHLFQRLLVLLALRLVGQIVNVDEEFGGVLDLADYLWTHERVLQNDLQLGQVLYELHDVELVVNLLLALLIQSLELFLLSPAAVAAEPVDDFRDEQFCVVADRESDDVVLLHFVDELGG